ncbi:MAG: deoxynucleoside kinase [Bacteroidota bacterium]
MSRLKYDYVVIEGNIGTGKTSLASRIARDFDTRLILERFADNPFLPKFYENQPRYAFPLELSFLADRYSQLKNDLTNLELFHQQTVSDYLLSKSLIFASITLKDHELDLYQKLFKIINPNLPKPDLLLYMHKDVPMLKQNIRKRGREYEVNITDDYLEKLERGYWDFFKGQSNMRILIVDSNHLDFVNNEADYQKIIQLLEKDFLPGLHRFELK